MKKKVPKAVLGAMGLETPSQFRRLKRRQLRAVTKAINQYRTGCFYCPGEFDIGGIARAIDKHQDELSVKNWGR